MNYGGGAGGGLLGLRGGEPNINQNAGDGGTQFNGGSGGSGASAGSLAVGGNGSGGGSGGGGGYYGGGGGSTYGGYSCGGGGGSSLVANGCSTSSGFQSGDGIIIISYDTCGGSYYKASITKTNVSCISGNNGSAIASASGGTSPYTYLWSNGQTTQTATGLIAGNYSVIVTGAVGCTRTASVTILQPSSALATPTVTNTPAGCNPPNGTATVNISGGVPPYYYLWSDGQTTKTATGLAAGGNYNVVITDSYGCSITGYTQMPAPNTPAVYISSVTPASCYGQCNGSASGYALGGTPPYHYQWSTVPVQTASTATGLCTGVYTLSVVDNWGCVNINTATANIQQPAALSLSLSAAPTSCGIANGSVTAAAGGGIIPYTYLWNPTAQTAQTASGLNHGSYSVTVTDMNGCSITGNDTVSLVTASTSICLVTVDSTFTKNVIVWEKPAQQGALSGFRIYRLIASAFTPIAVVPYSSMSMFVDTTFGVNPQITAYQYRISAVDTCGHESALSSIHQTINLSPPIYNPTPPSYTLYWTDYTGFTFSQYDIYRDDFNTGNWKKIDSVSYILPNQYTDPNPPSDSAGYFIQSVHPTGCTASLKYPAPMGTINTTRSNTFRTNGTVPTAVNETSLENMVSIYPNPNNGSFLIDIKNINSKFVTVKMYDVFGRLVYDKICFEKKTEINCNLAKGIYQLQIETGFGRVNRKIIIQQKK